MVMDSGLQELSGLLSGLRYDDYNPDQSVFLMQDSGNFTNSSRPALSSVENEVNGNIGDGTDDGEIFSDIALSYISRMLMEEDIDEKVNTYQQEAALRVAAKPFYDILGQKYPSVPDRFPLDVNCRLDSFGNCGYGKTNSGSTISGGGGVVVNSPGVEFSNYSRQPLLGFVNNGVKLFDDAFVDIITKTPNVFYESLPAWQFRKGVEEANKFLPTNNCLALNLEANGVSSRVRKSDSKLVEINGEVVDKEYYSPVNESRGRKNRNSGDLDLMEGRSNKQSAVFGDDDLRNEMFDSILLCHAGKCKTMSDMRQEMQNEVSKNLQNEQTKSKSVGKTRGKKQPKKEVVDLRTYLIHCAQAVAIDDHRTAHELLKQIRQHSSPNGNGAERLAYCFADGLEARLAGTGSQVYHSLVAKRTNATDILKAYHLYLAACPFKKISHVFSNQTIMNVAAKASKVHIIDFGIFYGFQWPGLIQRLSLREGGPPKLRITGIDVPQPGFRPSERIEETGRRLADYAKSFKVPFEYQGIASKWEAIRAEDLKINQDEVVIVNCLYRFRNLVDETVVVDSPRNRVLNTIRKANPHVFIHGVVNGSYSAPFFVTRFREALFHYTALFDMLESNVPRENQQRLLMERDLFGREALNVIACEGSERVERPETYKQWQVRNLRAGFEQLPLNLDIMRRVKDRIKSSYHKDFVIDEDNQWLLQGWKGRIIYAISSWKPRSS